MVAMVNVHVLDVMDQIFDTDAGACLEDYRSAFATIVTMKHIGNSCCTHWENQRG